MFSDGPFYAIIIFISICLGFFVGFATFFRHVPVPNDIKDISCIQDGKSHILSWSDDRTNKHLVFVDGCSQADISVGMAKDW